MAGVLGTRPVFAQTRVLSKPKPLAKDAVTHDWTAFLGPTHNATSTETRLSRRLPPPLIWEFTRGTGYASPAIAGARLVFLHRLGDEEIVECLHAETGATHWQFRYPHRLRRSLRIQQRPAIESGHRRPGACTRWARKGSCIASTWEPGTLIWKRDLAKEYRVRSGFFRHGFDAAD